MLSITNTYGGYTAKADEDEQGFITLLVYDENNHTFAVRCFLHGYMADGNDIADMLNGLPEYNRAIVSIALYPVLQCLVATAPKD